MTGDIDLASPFQPELEEELIRLGFTKPEGLGHTPLGWVHPDLGLGFEVVASTPMGGTVDHRRIVLIHALAEDETVATIPIEDFDRRSHGPVRLRHRAGAARTGAAAVRS